MSNLKNILKEVQEREEALEKAKSKIQKIKKSKKMLEDDFKEMVEEELVNKQPEEEKPIEQQEEIEIDERFSIMTPILEKQIDEKHRVVVAGVLQEDSLSANNRFYPSKVVRKAIKSLPGRRSIIGHESNSAEDVVAKIDRTFMRNGIGFAEFRFGEDDKSQMIFQKIKDGLIDSTSIRASGTTRRGRMGEKFVDVVESLKIASVDWVVEGGVEAAKVVQVFEQSPTITYDNNENELEEENSKMSKELEQKVEELTKQLEEQAKQIEEKDAKIAEFERQIAEAVLEAHRTKLLSEIENEEVREMLRGVIVGDSTEALDECYKKQIEILQKATRASNSKPVIKPVDEEKDETKYESMKDFLERAPKEAKGALLKQLMK